MRSRRRTGLTATHPPRDDGGVPYAAIGTSCRVHAELAIGARAAS